MLSVRDLLLGDIQRLSCVNRYTSYRVIRSESVAEHTCYVALYSLPMARDLLSHGVLVDIGALLSSAIVHDLDEALTGDFLRSVKYRVPGLKRALDEASSGIMRDLEDSLAIDGLHGSWSQAKSDTTEGLILRIADFFSVLSYVVSEVLSGNKHMLPVLPELRYYLSSLLEEILPLSGQGSHDSRDDLLRSYLSSALGVVDAALDDEHAVLLIQKGYTGQS